MAGRRGAGPPGLLLGPKGLGEGRAGLTVSGEKQRAGARLPPEALLAIPFALPSWEWRPPAQVGCTPWIGEGVS